MTSYAVHVTLVCRACCHGWWGYLSPDCPSCGRPGEPRGEVAAMPLRPPAPAPEGTPAGEGP